MVTSANFDGINGMVRPRKNCELIGGKSGPTHMIFVPTDVILEATVLIVGEMFATFVKIEDTPGETNSKR